jgi:hypothetical protein
MATVNVPQGSSMAKHNGQSFPIKNEINSKSGTSFYLIIGGNTVAFCASEIIQDV